MQVLKSILDFLKAIKDWFLGLFSKTTLDDEIKNYVQTYVRDFFESNLVKYIEDYLKDLIDNNAYN